MAIRRPQSANRWQLGHKARRGNDSFAVGDEPFFDTFYLLIDLVQRGDDFLLSENASLSGFPEAEKAGLAEAPANPEFGMLGDHVAGEDDESRVEFGEGSPTTA